MPANTIIAKKFRANKPVRPTNEREAHFQKQLRTAFECMSRLQRLPFNRKYLTSFFILKKPVDFMDFFKRYHEEISPALDPFLGGPPHCGPFRQIYETLKNAAAHGGDALIAVRRIQVLWIGGKGIGLEITVWDNGPGIGDVKAALLRGFTTRPDPLSDFYGQGKGLDMLYCREPFRYAADELMIESGNGKASRRSPFGPYRFERLQKFVPGTRVTIRFWPWRK